MKTYEETTFSGLDWLGDMPSHWQVKRLKNIARINPLKNIADDADEITTFLPMEKVSEKGEINCSLKRPVKDLLVGFTYFEKNDIILAKITPCFENGKGAYLNKLDTPFGFGSTEFHVIRTLEKLDSTFLYYVTTSNLFRDLGEASMTGSGGQKRVPTSFVENFPLAFPPLPEQRAIAAYLDRKTAQLDTLLAQKEALLQMLLQKRQALINEAVTQGLDPAAPRKPSGVAWLGDVPAHWEVMKLCYASDVNYGITLQLEKGKTTGMKIITVSNITTNGQIVLENQNYIDTHLVDEEDILRRGDILFNWRNGSATHVGKTAIFDLEGTYTHVSFLLRLRAKEKITAAYLVRFLGFLRSTGFFGSAKDQVNKTFNASELKQLPIIVPSLKEQKEVESWIVSRTAGFLKTQELVETQIKTLKAYRQSLISEVVTGKVDVRTVKAVAPEADLPLWRR